MIMRWLPGAWAAVTALFWLAARRLWTNRQLTAGLLVGFTVAVGAAAGIPAYSAGSLQRVLQTELAGMAGPLPAAVLLNHSAQDGRVATRDQFLAADRYAQERGPGLIGLPVEPFVRYVSLDVTRATPVDPARVNPDLSRWITLAALSDLDRHVAVVDGRLPRPAKTAAGAYEAMVEEAALEKQEFTVGAAFWVPLNRSPGAPRVQVEVVGAFRPTEVSDPYWFKGASPFTDTIFVPENTMREDLLAAAGVELHRASWYFGVRSADVRTDDVARLLNGLAELEGRVAQSLPNTKLEAQPAEILSRYVRTAALLRQLLLWLSMPALFIAAFFLVVTSGQMVAGQRQEIAALRSRGASVWQVISLYLLEGVLMAAAAMAIGMPLGMALARSIGSAAGFLQFVDRRPIPLLLPAQFYTYAFCAALLAVLAYVAPAVLAAGQSIVTYKQESARQSRRPLWARWGLDFLCLALAGYGYYTLRRSHEVLLALRGERAAEVGRLLEPLHVLGPVLFVFGAGLLCLRILPSLANSLTRLSGKGGNAPIHLSLVQLGRASAQYSPVVLLLTLTVGMGLYSADAARTMEQNTADRLYYANGADVQLEEVWEYIEHRDPGGSGAVLTEVVSPPWQIHYGLPGVAHAARVRTQEVEVGAGGKRLGKGQLVAVDPADFGRVSWFRRDLAPHHLNQYLNLLGGVPDGVLVSSAFLGENRLKTGDRITLTVRDREVSLVVLATVDYWPAVYPQDGPFFITHLDLVESELGIAPYRIWLKMDPGASVGPLVDTLRERRIILSKVADTRSQLIMARRDPQFGGLLGSLTSGFLLAAALTVLGFLLYASLSARARTLQFGVLRAIGLSAPQLMGMVALEQLLAVAAGVAVGTGLGQAAAHLFIPFMQQGAGAQSQTPPFAVVTDPVDGLRLYVVLTVMLLLGLAGLMWALARLRVHEAIKLGEDR